MATDNVSLMDTPFLKTSMVIGCDPLNTTHDIVTVITPDGGRVIFCPHVKDAKIGTNFSDAIDGGTRFGSPMKR